MVTGFYSGKEPWVGHEVDHLSPSSANVKNEWSYMSTASTCLHGVDRDNFTITFIILNHGTEWCSLGNKTSLAKQLQRQPIFALISISKFVR